jgi:hypothetical protein
MSFKDKMRKPTVITGVIAASLITAGTAFAAVAGAPVASANGSAGYDTNTVAPLGQTDVQSVVTGGQYGLGVAGGAHGLQLCNTTTARAAQIGLLSDNLKTTYRVATAVGTLPAPGCPVGGVLPGEVTFPGLANVPFGHRVWMEARLVRANRVIRVLICTPRGPLGPVINPLAPDQLAPVGLRPGPGLFPGFRCFFRPIVISRAAVVFLAQDLSAPTVNPLAGDLAGVQVRIVPVPSSTRYTDAGAGVNQNTAKLVACAGNGFPAALAGPAAYESAACQPISAFDHTTHSVGGGAAQSFLSSNTTEGVSPGTTVATPALIAPNNSLVVTPASVTPGTASGASTGGDSFTMFSANLPTT